MTPFPWIDVLVIAGLVVLNGLFSMSELAIVSARQARLKVAVERGLRGAKAALALSENPGTLLSTAQIGITLIALITGAFSEASLGHPVAERLAGLGLSPQMAEHAGLVLVIAVTTFVSLIAGELVPKQLALRSAETIAMIAAPPMAVMARATAPLVWLLDWSTNRVLALLRVRAASEPQVTEEEIHLIFAEAARSGVIEEEERAIMAGIMRLADRPVRELMTPRTEIDWIALDASEMEVREELRETPHSLLPVADGAADNIVGVVKVRELQAALLSGRPLKLAALVKKAEIIPDQLDAMDALRLLQQAEVSMALVHDEYGNLEGVVTPKDLLTALVGTFASDHDDGDTPLITLREDGSLLIAGALAADTLADRLGLELPDTRDYATAAGYVLSVLKRLPVEGEAFEDQGWRFEVVDMDGRKIDKLLVARVVVDDAATETG